MKYALLIYEDETAYGGEDSPAVQAIIGKHETFGLEAGAAITGGAGLRNTDAATTVRTEGGRQVLHDGPFAEAKEQLGGFYIVDVPDLDAALALARTVPLHGDGAVTKAGIFCHLHGGHGGPDGLAWDPEGNLLVAHTGVGTVWRLSPHAEPTLGIVSCAGASTTNLCLGGADGRELFITESETGSVLRARLEAPERER